MTKPSFEIGQKVVFEIKSHRAGAPPAAQIATVASIGRRWVNVVLEGGFRDRFDPEAMESDGGEYAGKDVFVSIEAFEEHQRKTAVWEQIRAFMRSQYDVPEAPTDADLREVLRLMRGGSE